MFTFVLLEKVVIFVRQEEQIMITKKECIRLLQSCSGTLRERFGVRTLCLFGSVARNEQKRPAM